MRLLRGELRKLRRPLVYWLGLAVVVLSCLLVRQVQATYELNNPKSSSLPGPAPTPTCAQLGLPVGSRCAAVQQGARQADERFRGDALTAARLAKAGQQPLGVGRFAAGLFASLLGAGAVLLLAGAHVGGEWGGRTIKSILVQDGRRGRLLAAKWASLWLTGAALLAVTWATLALISPYLAHAYGNPSVHLPAGQAAGAALSQSARTLLVLGVFSALGVAAAVLTRSLLGTFFLGAGVVVVSLLLGQFGTTARWTLAYWVTGWMGFGRDEAVPDYLWSTRLPAGVPAPTAGFGFAALICSLLVMGALAWSTLRRSDVTI